MTRTLTLFLTLLLPLFLYAQEPGLSQAAYAHTLVATIEQQNRLVTELTTESLEDLPVGIKKHINGTKYIIAIDSVRFTERGIMLSVYTELTLHKNKQKIAFAGKNIRFTPSGIDPGPAGRLVLISQHSAPISEQVTIILPSDGHNYVKWDCEGFRAVNLKGILEFSPEIFTPAATLAHGAASVQGAFEIHTTDLNNILLSVSITPFQLKSSGNIAFEVKNATWDMSDTANPPGCVFPLSYADTYGDDPTLWQGFFLRETNVYLPQELGNKTIHVENMLIDDSGLTGHFAVTGVLPLQEGSAGGWPFSIERLSVQLVANQLAGGSMGGVIGIPFLGNDTLGYQAQISSGPQGIQYAFTTIFNKQKQYNTPLGDLWLHQGSALQMKVADGQFTPSAILNGALTIRQASVKMDSIRFENFHLTASAPYILGGTFSSEAKAGFRLAGFGLSIDSIRIVAAAGMASLGVNAKVGLMDNQDKGISADTRFYVKAKVTELPRQQWQFDGLSVDRINLDCQLSLFTLKGSIGLYNNHHVYGDGFEGAINFSVAKLIPKGIEAEIRFGTVTGTKYWYTRFGVPVKISIGPVTIDGIEGGAYHRMKKENLHDPKNSNYLPDATAGMGFMSGVGLSVVKEKLFYATAGFEIAFNEDWGVRFVQFTGTGQFFSGKTEKSSVPVRVALNMSFDFENAIFNANMKTYMNLANVLKGSGPDGLLGEAVIQSGPGSDWHIYIGRPSSPFGLKLLGIAEAQSYFMAGTKIEDMPLPRDEVRSILGDIDLGFMQKEHTLKTGSGMGFGVSFDVSIGIGREKGFVYAFLDLGAGADITLRDFGQAECDGSGVIGIDGWYAAGQAYAYMQGKIGIRVKKREFDIMSVGMAALLQAKMPNPVWMHGTIAARYRILGGLIKGKVSVGVTIGKECENLDNSELGNIALIADIQPAQGGRDVDVFAAPQVAFNTSIDTEFGMMNLNDEYHTYRVAFDEFKLTRQDNSKITGTIKWNQSKDVAVLKTRDILPGMTQLTAEAKVHIEKKNGQQWEALTFKGAIDYETKSVSFTTGAEPTTISENNVPYSYPMRNQYHFYKDEHGQGYVKLGQGQPKLFYTTMNGAQWNYVTRIQAVGSLPVEVPASYNDHTTTVSFQIPKGLFNAQVYRLQIVRKQADGGAIDRNVQRTEVQLTRENLNDSVAIALNTLEGSIGSGGEKVLHELDFRTSNFNTFMAKLNSMGSYRELYAVEHSLMSLLAIEGNLNETFDTYELKGHGEEMPPLISAVALQNNSWLNSHAYPLVYELYGTDPDLKLERDINILGLVPLKGMWLFNAADQQYLLEENQKKGGASAHNGYVTCRYNIAYHIYQDFIDLRDKAAAKYIDKNIAVPPVAMRLLSGNLDDIHRGRYDFKLSYRLPGTEKATSEKEYGIVF